MWVQSLWEDPLEEEMATNSSIFTWKIPWSRAGIPGNIQDFKVNTARQLLTWGGKMGLQSFSGCSQGHYLSLHLQKRVGLAQHSLTVTWDP